LVSRGFIFVCPLLPRLSQRETGRRIRVKSQFTAAPDMPVTATKAGKKTNQIFMRAEALSLERFSHSVARRLQIRQPHLGILARENDAVAVEVTRRTWFDAKIRLVTSAAATS